MPEQTEDEAARIERALQEAKRQERAELESQLEHQQRLDEGIANALTNPKQE